jgi:hypothetical protein
MQAIGLKMICVNGNKLFLTPKIIRHRANRRGLRRSGAGVQIFSAQGFKASVAIEPKVHHFVKLALVDKPLVIVSVQTSDDRNAEQGANPVRKCESGRRRGCQRDYRACRKRSTARRATVDACWLAGWLAGYRARIGDAYR